MSTGNLDAPKGVERSSSFRLRKPLHLHLDTTLKRRNSLPSPAVHLQPFDHPPLERVRSFHLAGKGNIVNCGDRIRRKCSVGVHSKQTDNDKLDDFNELSPSNCMRVAFIGSKDVGIHTIKKQFTTSEETYMHSQVVKPPIPIMTTGYTVSTNNDIELTAGVTGQQGMLTSPWHLMPPLASSGITDENLEAVSTVVSKTMFYTMVSHFKSSAQKNQILTLERLYWKRNKGVVRRYFGGSAAEGTAIPGSDVDKMIETTNIIVCINEEKSKKIKGHIFVCDEENGCQTGYTKLREVKVLPDLPTIFDDHGTTLENMLVEGQGGKRFLSSSKIVDFWINFLGKLNSEALKPEYRHGPSATTVNEDIHGLIHDKIGANLEQDFAFSIALDAWPTGCDEWFDRRRIHSWPSTETVNKIKSLKCHVVPMGDKTSCSFSLEWRVSYLLAERELVWSFNDIQLQCYTLMKKLFKKYIYPVAPDELSTYHIKIILFWESENSSSNTWQQKNLIRCVQCCLSAFKKSVQALYLEHYIDRRRNLMLGKLADQVTRDAVIQCLDDVSEDTVTCILGCVEGVDLLSLWMDSDMRANEFIQICKDTQDDRITMGFDDYKPSLELYYLSNASFAINAELVLADFRKLALYFEAYSSEESGNDIDLHFSQNVLKFINTRSSIILVKQILNSTEKVDAREKLEKLYLFMNKIIDIDAVAGKLYLATYFYCMGNNKKVISIIEEILKSEQMNLIYVGRCSKSYGIEISRGQARQLSRIPCRTKHEARFLSTVHDVMFSNDDLCFLPFALQFECLMDRAILIHPLVYLYYLQTLCCPDSDCVRALEEVVFDCTGTPQFYRQLNVLGHCHFQRENYRRAFECYIYSMKQTLTTKIRNAALYHIILLVFKLVSNANREECIYRRN